MNDLNAFQFRQGFQDTGNQGRELIFPTPFCFEYGNWNVTIAYVLLIFQILIERDESVEFLSGEFQEFTVALSAPSHSPDCRNVVSDENAPELHWH